MYADIQHFAFFPIRGDRSSPLPLPSGASNGRAFDTAFTAASASLTEPLSGAVGFTYSIPNLHAGMLAYSGL